MKPKYNYLINREISWLDFNARVMQEASDPNTPLIERLKFLGIFSNNRDEFFRVRVATLTRMTKFEKEKSAGENNPRRTLTEISKIVLEQERKFTQIYREIVEELKKYRIYIINESQLDTNQGLYVKKYFHENVRVHQFPLILDNARDLSSLKDKSIYLAVHLLKSTRKDSESFALIKVPTSSVPRFVLLPKENEEQYIILLDDVIRYCLEDIFGIFGYDTFNAYTIKFTRDAEMDIDNDVSKSFLEIMAESIKQRKKGVPVRFVYDENIPQHLLKKLTKKLKITDDDNLRSGGRYHNFKDFMSFPSSVGPPELTYTRLKPIRHPLVLPKFSILDAIASNDIMLHFPYHSFKYIIDLLREASIDPKVRSIKMTFYRAARDSNVMNALINAARNGKYVTVFLELQARFDEEANIMWAERLQEEGVRVIHSIPGLKVHCKLICIRRKENNENVYYANVSTGNFNESTATVYSDDSLLTANQKIAREVNDVFHLFEMKYSVPTFRHLVVSPFQTRKFFTQLIQKEISNALKGKEAWIQLKLNSLVDDQLVKKLYQASQAGVKIDIIARGICVLIPGVEGLSENINAISIVDRFLEHSRIYIFCNEGDPKYFISSADWMQRNLDHRIEVTCPIWDKKIQAELKNILEIQLADNTKARIISKDQPNQYQVTGEVQPRRAQFDTYDYFKQFEITDPEEIY